jgi:hypothetical protein
MGRPAVVVKDVYQGTPAASLGAIAGLAIMDALASREVASNGDEASAPNPIRARWPVQGGRSLGTCSSPSRASP